MDLITRQVAASILRLSVARVRQLEASGQLTKLTNSVGAVRYRRDEVLALKRARETWHALAV